MQDNLIWTMHVLNAVTKASCILGVVVELPQTPNDDS